MKTAILIALLFIFYNLGVAMYYMIKDKGQGKNTVRFLTVRIAASFGLFILIIIALKMGWLQAHSLMPIVR
ncbi:MAG: twin transmembrane helix small protein [Proteobacteria bacterium]|nr:twin transmembrane helix small protein [Pseudomonadota bacterium]